MRIYSLMVCAALGLAACASVSKGDAARDATLKNFMPRPGVAGVYVYRNEGIGSFTAMEVLIDGKSVGRIAEKTYLFVELAPGPHVVAGKSGESLLAGVEFNAVPGKLYYLKQELKRTNLVSISSRLARVDDIEGQHEIKRTSLAAGAGSDAP